jgi:transcriptional regulator with XRE-family HTH domain
MAANLQELFQIKNRILGVLIQEARQASGQSQTDCAQLLGLSDEAFAAFESGQSAPTLPQLEILAYVFNLPIKHFWGADTLASARRHDDIKDRVPDLVVLRQKMIGIKIQQLRDRAGFSTAQVAEKTGIAAERIEQIEQGLADSPISELEFLVRAVQGILDDLVEDRGPVGNWLQAQKDFEAFTKLPPELREFALKPINRSYIELAVKLSQMQVDQLRSIAEGRGLATRKLDKILILIPGV